MHITLRRLIATSLLFLLAGLSYAQDAYLGSPRDVILQGFHWNSQAGSMNDDFSQRTTWYAIVRENAGRIQEAEFTWVWLPPPSDTADDQGYLPRKWFVLDTNYGSETQLRETIAALQPVKAMADVVINHRVGVRTAGGDFDEPAFDEGDRAVVEGDEFGGSKGGVDSGGGYSAARDLDHANASVQTAVGLYLERLKDVGFEGWRYDMVLGFAGKFVAKYNDESHPLLSIGEYWDDRTQSVIDWVDSTGGAWENGVFRAAGGAKSAAFDFPTRSRLHHAITTQDYSGMSVEKDGRRVPPGVIGFWPRVAVTFVDNHDTEWRRNGEYAAHFPGDAVSTAYAYVLTHPGIPSVFWSHYFDWDDATRDRIERLIKLRRDQGIAADSEVEIREAKPGLYVAVIDGETAVKLGPAPWDPTGLWPSELRVDGPDFAVWVKAGG